MTIPQSPDIYSALIAQWHGRAHELGHRRQRHTKRGDYDSAAACMVESSTLSQCADELQAASDLTDTLLRHLEAENETLKAKDATIQILRAALADIAMNRDMSLGAIRWKALRVYEQTAPQEPV